MHSWKCSQITEGFNFFAWIALATFAAAAYGMPTAARAIVHTRMKSRRSTDDLRSVLSSTSVDVIPTSCERDRSSVPLRLL